MPDWLVAAWAWMRELEWRPNNPLEVVLLALATAGAWWFASRTNRIAAAKHVPVLTIELNGNRTYVVNSGPGVALNVCLADRRFRTVTFVGTIGPGKRRLVQLALETSETYRIYCQSALERFRRRTWFRSDVLVESPFGQMRVLAGRFNRRVAFLPPQISALLSADDLETTIVKMERSWDPRNWPQRLKPYRMRLIREFWRIRYGTSSLLYETDFRLRTHAQAHEPAEDVRARWPVDLRGFVACLPGILFHYDCSREPSGDLVLDVGFDMEALDRGGWGEVRGWVVVRAKTQTKLAAMTRDDRNRELFRRFAKEYCRRRSGRSFVVVL